jgi:hypothetical protein
VKILSLFGSNLTEVEARLFENLKKTKAVFPEETQRIEWGLALMRDLTQITEDAVKDYQTKPNLFTNHNLFSRNRQLLLNAYFCLLSSSYGTEFVILRTVLENNNLMRLFNKNPQYAFEWLSMEMQKRFSQETQLKYGKSGKHDRTYKAWFVRKYVFDEIEREKVREDIKQFYGALCNYTHPNFRGWHELIGKLGEVEIILNMPRFQEKNAETAVGMSLFLMQTSFKGFVETFKGYLAGFAYQLQEWQDNFNKLILKFKD